MDPTADGDQFGAQPGSGNVSPPATGVIGMPPPAPQIVSLLANAPINAGGPVPPNHPPLFQPPPVPVFPFPAAGGMGPGAGNAPPMPPIRDDTVVCVVCGGVCKVTVGPVFFQDRTPDWMRPVLVRAKKAYIEWQKQRVSARRTNGRDAELVEQIQVTEFLGGGQGMRLNSEILRIDTADPLMRIPIHGACFSIAQRFCNDQLRYGLNFRSAFGGAPSSILHLYEIWCKRAIATCPEGLVTKPILEANGYFGMPEFPTMMRYHAALRKDRSLRRFLAYPLEIPGLTDMVVSKLQTIDGRDLSPRGDLAELWRHIQRLPQEIFDLVIDALEPFEEKSGLPLTPTRILPAGWWKNKLLSGTLIPWLWDLDEKHLVQYRIRTLYNGDHVTAAKDQEESAYVFDEDMWDWERLCRQLAQPDVLGREGLLKDQSDQLWNRYRIWKLLDAARLGHVIFPRNV